MSLSQLKIDKAVKMAFEGLFRLTKIISVRNVDPRLKKMSGKYYDFRCKFYQGKV